LAIIERDGFKFLDGLNSDYLVIESKRLTEYASYIKQNNIKSIAFTSLNYTQNDLKILEQCPNIEHVKLTSDYVNDYSSLHYLESLKSLYCTDVKDSINLAAFSEIKTLAIEVNAKISGLKKSNTLRNLFIWKYKPMNSDISEFSNLQELEHLVITQSSIISLKGIGNLTKLIKLELNYLSKLERIDELTKNQSTLKELSIYNCKNIKDHERVANLRKVEKLMLANCGEIKSIRFIKQLPNLKSFVFPGTNVLDGDINPCIGIEHVVFTNKKHYSHKVKDLLKE
jgi:hypothetical protein